MQEALIEAAQQWPGHASRFAQGLAGHRRIPPAGGRGPLPHGPSPQGGGAARARGGCGGRAARRHARPAVPVLPPRASPRPSQLALTLRAVGGLTTAEIAAAFFVPESTMAQRISRAKQQLRTAGFEFGPPPTGERDARLRVVMRVLYLVFNEGYTASAGENALRPDLTTRGHPDHEDAARGGTSRAARSPRSAGPHAADGRPPAGSARPHPATWSRSQSRTAAAGTAGRSRRASASSPMRCGSGPVGPVPGAGGDRCQPRRSGLGRGHQLRARSSASTTC